MEEHDDNRKSLADILAIGDDERLWEPDDLAAILKHQLAAPIEFDLSRFDLSHSMEQLRSPDGEPIGSFNELFHHPHPPVKILELTKRFAKECRRGDDPLPDEIATILYTLSIVVALAKCGQRITKADDQTLRHSLDWALHQPWLDESTLELLRSGYIQMSTLDRGARAEKTPAMSGAEMSEVGQLGEYDLLEELGRGGMGTVYKARHTQLERIVAVKILPEAHMANQRAVARFRREIKAVGRLDHPNIVRAHDARQIGNKHFLVMEYVDGLDLAELSTRLGPLPVADVCEMVRQAATGLAYAHQNSLVHRDIKPSNLMLTGTGQLKVLDLGLARIQSDPSGSTEMTAVGQVMGTPDYMAPEQVTDTHSVDIRADIYSLGCTLYKLLTGEAPFAKQYADTVSRMAAHARDTVPPIEQFRDDLPNGLTATVNRMLAKSPDERFAEPGEVAAAMEPFTRGSDLTALLAIAKGRQTRSAGVPGKAVHLAAGAGSQPAARRRGRTLPWWQRPWAMIVAAVLLAAALGTVFLLSRDKGGEDAVAVGGKDGGSQDGRSPLPVKNAAPDVGGSPAAAVTGRPGIDDWIVLSWSKGVGSPNLWLCSPDGNTKIPITSDPQSFDIHPKFSPDGRRIAFIRGKSPPGRTAVWICDTDGGNPRELVASQGERERLASPVWVSNSRIYYARDPKLDREPDMEAWRVDLDGGEPERVFRFQDNLGEGVGLITDVSPDRRRLALVAQRAGDHASSDIYITDLQGRRIHDVWTDNEDDRKDGRALWSPTGKTIAWQHTFSEIGNTPSMGGKRPRPGSLLPPHDVDRVGPRPPGRKPPKLGLIKQGIGLSRLGDDGQWHSELQGDKEAVITPLAWSPDGRFLLCTRFTEMSRGLMATLFLMDDQFKTGRSLFPLDGGCWQSGQFDFGRLADWAFVPQDIILPGRR